jgi:energy-coupling factor transporter ATP-binding protein EcfA2
MKWMTRLELNNYRFFAKPVSFSIPFGHHLLIYGENGSGKTSIYKSVSDFFRSSMRTIPDIFKLNEFEKSDGNLTGSVKLDVSDDVTGKPVAQNYSFNEPPGDSTHQVPDIQVANKVKGFLDYRVILKLHALQKPGIVNPGFFKFFVHELLRNHRINNPAGGTSTVELSQEYSRIIGVLQNSRRNSIAFKTTLDQLNILNLELRNLLKNVMDKVNEYLVKYFKNKTTIDFGYTDLEVKEGKKPTESISLRVSYAQQRLVNYNNILNEARLSALSICMYLASIKINSIPADSLRILFLDDVFIGLDMCNRMPLLELIKHEFIDENFQVIISTFDRSWFELSRQWLENEKCKYSTLELFTNESDEPSIPDMPVVVNDKSDYFGCGKSYFEKRDYPAAANYLRKACEFELRRILPQHMTLKADLNSGEVKKINILEPLIQKFFDFLDKNALDATPFRDFQTYKKIILNPLSHDDLQAPHYSREIKDCIALVENLRKIKTKVIVDLLTRNSKPLKLGVRDATYGNMHQYEFHLCENLSIIQQNSQPIKLSAIECDVAEGGNSTHYNTIQLAFDQINIERGYPATTDYTDFYTNISVTNNKKLKAVMVF